jgi:hypothetical protein
VSRVRLTFTLCATDYVADLLHEFSLHDDVHATVDASGESYLLTVDVPDTTSAIWDVRATVGMFDDAAVETTERETQT